MTDKGLKLVNKELRALAVVAEDQGWEVRMNGGHLQWIGPDGLRKASSGSTPSRRSIQNLRAALKRNGLDLTGTHKRRRPSTGQDRLVEILTDPTPKETTVVPAPAAKKPAPKGEAKPPQRSKIRKGMQREENIIIMAWVRAHPDQTIYVEAAAREMGLPQSEVTRWLGMASNWKPGEGMFSYNREFAGRVHRIATGVYWFQDRLLPTSVATAGAVAPPTVPTTPVPEPEVVAPTPADPPQPVLNGGLEKGTILEVDRTWDSGRVLLADPDGVLYAGTLRRID